MYIHDYLLAYNGGNPGDGKTATGSWIYSLMDKYNKISPWEGLITRAGLRCDTCTDLFRRAIRDYGVADRDVTYSVLTLGVFVRPTFYLSSEAKIKDGDGTKENPYVLDVQE